MDKDDSINLLIVLGVVAVLLTGLTVEWKTKSDEARLCRHAIQRGFAKSSEEATRLIEETREWESR